jgi:DNA-binding CsgD family transcriptional regulator
MARSPVRQRLVALLLSGESRKEIARILQRSPHTIDAHLKAIYRHVGIGDRGRLMLLASQLAGAKTPPRNWGLFALSSHVKANTRQQQARSSLASRSSEPITVARISPYAEPLLKTEEPRCRARSAIGHTAHCLALHHLSSFSA